MCGLFGFSGPGRHDPVTLAEIAGLAARRGPDGWGAVVDGRRLARVERLTQAVAAAWAPASLVLGHCRLSTVLGTKRVECCQPIQVGRWAVAHNGTVPNAEDLGLEFGFSLSTGVDSEAIAHLLHVHAGDLDAVMARVDHGGHFAVAAADVATGTVELRASGLPMWRLQRPEGLYWCSVRPGDGWEAAHA